MTAQKRNNQERKPAVWLRQVVGNWLKGWRSGWSSRLRRLTGLLTGGGAILLLALIILAQVILLVNPYQRASDRVKFLLDTQPGFESRLDATEITSAAVKNQLAAHSASAITQRDNPAADLAFITFLTLAGIPRTDAVDFIGLAKSLASEVLSLSNALEFETNTSELSRLLEIARQPGEIDSATLIRLMNRTPSALEQINNLRLHLQAIANGMRLINENHQFQPILARLEEVLAAPDPLMAPAVLYYAVGFYAWQELALSCESLEIQFSGDVLILNEIFTAVNQAQQPASRLGYKQLEPPARWIQRHTPLLGAICLTLLLISAGLLFGKDRLPAAFPTLRLRLPSRQTPMLPTARLSKPSPRRYFSSILRQVRQLQSEKIPSPRGQPVLQIARESGTKFIKILRGDRSVGIGSDPHNSIHIPAPDQGFIEVWIRPAKVGFYIEVMHSQTPVLLNDQPISGARRLTNGDTIKILDFNLIFQG